MRNKIPPLILIASAVAGFVGCGHQSEENQPPVVTNTAAEPTMPDAVVSSNAAIQPVVTWTATNDPALPSPTTNNNPAVTNR